MQRSPFSFLRGGGSALPSLQLCWGTWPSYEGGAVGGPLFSDRAGQGQLGPVCLSCLHFNVKPLSWLASSVFENKLLFVLL